MVGKELKKCHAEMVVEQAPGSATITNAECMDGPDSSNQMGEVCECRCCGQQKMFEDPEEIFESRVCTECFVVEDSRQFIMRGHEEHWIDKRGGRWFLWYCHHVVCTDRFVCRIEPPAEDENLYYDEDGELKGPDPWHGYDGDGGVKDGWEW